MLNLYYILLETYHLLFHAEENFKLKTICSVIKFNTYTFEQKGCYTESNLQLHDP